MIDYLIVGAGLTGATIARTLTDAGATVLVLEKQPHTGGNVRDVLVDGIRVHLHGGHIFHTNSDAIWRYVNRFAEWQRYEHRVKAFHKGRMYSFPPNALTFQQLGVSPTDAPGRKRIYDTFFAGYSTKQWGRPAEDVPDSVIKRIPIRQDYDDRYFTDTYQALPVNGYAAFVDALLADIPVETGTDFLTDREYWTRQAHDVIYTGMPDALFGYDLGRLEYRSLRFEHEWTRGTFQGCATVNYTDYKPDYTRIMEWKYFDWTPHAQTIYTREYPEAYTGENIPYYPVNNDDNNALATEYARRAAAAGITVAGRLGKYRYYNMDQAIAHGIVTARRLLTTKERKRLKRIGQNGA